MTYLAILGSIFVGLAYAVYKLYVKPYPVASTDNSELEVPVVTPEPAPEAPKQPAVESLDWTTQKGAYHATRVLCDNHGLTLDEKNLLCSVIYQESEFKNTAKHDNGTSTDWGILQINDHYHIGKGKDFPSVQYVLDYPDKAVEFMIQMYKADKLALWVGYSSGAFKKWLSPSSPMWKLST